MKTAIKLFGTITMFLFMACSSGEKNEQYDTSLFPVEIDDKWGYVNHKGEYVINPQFQWANLFSNGMARIGIDGKTGFINEKGEIIITPQYSSSTKFHKGKAWVIQPGNAPELIDQKGKVLLTYKKGRNVHMFSEGLAIVTDDNNNNWVINEDGETIFRLPEKHSFCSNYMDGVAIIRNGDWDYGYIDKKGQIIIGCQFDNAEPFRDGKAIVKKDDMYGVINKEGKFIINPQFKTMTYDNDGYVVSIGDKYGWCDNKGKLTINPQFDAFLPYKGNKLTGVMINSKVGFIDKEGKYVINPQFDDASEVFNDVIWVKVENKWGLINSKGEYIANPQFDNVSAYTYVNPFYEYVISEYFDIEGITSWITTKLANGKFDGFKISETTISQFRDKYKIGTKNYFEEKYSRDMEYKIIAEGTFSERVSDGWWGTTLKPLPNAKLDYIHLNIQLSDSSKYNELYNAINKNLAIKNGRTNSGLYIIIEQNEYSLSIYVNDKPINK